MRNQYESGMFKYPDKPLTAEKEPRWAQCFSPWHRPPMHIHVPAGSYYRHVCPECGHVVILHNTMRG